MGVNQETKVFSTFILGLGVLLGEQIVLWGELNETYDIALLREMKKIILTVIAISALLISLMALTSLNIVRSESTDFINFDSGIGLFSPLNTTYNFRNLALNLTVPVGYIHADAGQVVTNVVMNYSIDGTYNGPVFLYIAETQTHMVIMGAGRASLPELPDGSHKLTLYTYGLNMQSYTPQYKSYVSTMYFSIYAPNSTFIPTPSPIPTPTVTPSPSLSTTPSLTPSASPSPSINQSTTPSPSQTPSLSLTPEPTIEPSQSAIPSLETKNSINSLLIITGLITVVIIAVVSAGLFVYFKKIKK